MVRACRGLGLRSATWRGQPGWEAEVGSPGAGLVREAALTWKAGVGHPEPVKAAHKQASLLWAGVTWERRGPA